MAEKRKDPARVTLKDVRLSFAHLFRPQAFGDGDGEPKYNANFLIDDSTKVGKANLDAIEDAIAHVKSEKWPKGAPKLSDEKVCLRDGNKSDYDGYEDMFFVSANNAKAPLCLDRDKTEVVEADNVLYSGCYVDAIVRVWAQDNKWGKRINASLEAVRFRRDGEAFGAAPPDPDDFDDLEDDEDDRGSRRRSRDDDDDRGSSRRGSSRRGRDDEKEEDDRGSRRRSRDDDDDRGSRRRSRDDDDDDGGSRRRSRDDEDDERGSSRRRGKDDDDDRGSSRRRSRDDEDDDVDRPSRNSRSRRRGDDDDI